VKYVKLNKMDNLKISFKSIVKNCKTIADLKKLELDIQRFNDSYDFSEMKKGAIKK